MSFQQHGSGNHAVPARCRRGERGRSSFPAAPWLLRAGYPGGVPDVDYIPLFALLGSQLSDSDVHAIAEELANESKPESAETIRQAIATVTDHPASDADVARVKARLAAGGWPVGSSSAVSWSAVSWAGAGRAGPGGRLARSSTAAKPIAIPPATAMSAASR